MCEFARGERGFMEEEEEEEEESRFGRRFVKGKTLKS
jgi:hypothetical protein